MIAIASNLEQQIASEFVERAQEILPGTKLRWLVRSSESSRSMIAAVRLPPDVSADRKEAFLLHELSGDISERFEFDFSITATGYMPDGERLGLDFIAPEYLSLEPTLSPWFARYEIARKERDTDAYAAERDLLDSLELAVKQYGRTSAPVYTCLQMLAKVYLQNLGMPTKAVAALMATKELLDSVDKEPSLLMLDVLDSLAEALKNEGRHVQAFSVMKQTLKIRETIFGKTDWNTINNLIRLAESGESSRLEFYGDAAKAIKQRLVDQKIDPEIPHSWTFNRISPESAMSQAGELEKLADVLHGLGNHNLEDSWRAVLDSFWVSIDRENRDWFRFGVFQIEKEKNAEPNFFLTLFPLSRPGFDLRVAKYDYQDLVQALSSVGITGIPPENDWHVGTSKYLLVHDVPRSAIVAILHRPEYGTY